MHNMLAALFSIFFLSAPTTARVLPPTRRAPSSLADKCSFTLWHKQLHPFAPASSSTRQPKQNYIQINALVDHTNDITVDVAHARPAEAFNSYVYVAATHVFAITGLVDGTNLTVRGEDGSDWLRFQSEEMVWTAGGEKDDVGGAWCEVGEWDVGVGESTVDSRERRLECAFLCEKIEMEEEERVELR